MVGCVTGESVSHLMVLLNMLQLCAVLFGALVVAADWCLHHWRPIPRFLTPAFSTLDIIEQEC